MYKPRYLDKEGKPISTPSRSIWEILFGYKPKYIVPAVQSLRVVGPEERRPPESERPERP